MEMDSFLLIYIMYGCFEGGEVSGKTEPPFSQKQTRKTNHTSNGTLYIPSGKNQNYWNNTLSTIKLLFEKIWKEEKKLLHNIVDQFNM